MEKSRFLDKMLGIKLFKQNDDESVHMIRIIDMKKICDDLIYKIKDYETNEVKKVPKDDLKGYTPLEPDAILTASIVTFPDNEGLDVKDVIVTSSKYLEAKAQLPPYVVCRQNVSDIFAEMFCTSEENMMVGMSISRDTCPAEFEMNIMMVAENIIFHELVNFYRTDTLDDILEMIDTYRFDAVLSDLYKLHCNINPAAMMKNSDNGWCKTFKELLKTNNFQSDINQMLGITELGFELAPYFVEKTVPGKDIKYNVLRDDVRYWLSSIFKQNIKEANVLEFDHDINIVDFKNSRYFLFRDSTKKMYLVVYLIEGEYLESDLEAKAKEYDFSTKFKIDFYNKYNAIKDSSVNIDLS